MEVHCNMEEVVAGRNGSKNVKEESPTKDKLFDPSVDMLVNDFDDERTLEEEEALAAGEADDPNAELSCLQKESNMPLSELLALYGYRDENQENDCPIEDAEDPLETMEEQEAELMEEPPVSTSKLKDIYDPIPDNEQEPSRLLPVSRVSEEEDEDYDYSSDEDEWRKTIMVGSDYQAQIPDGLCHYDDALPYENEDKLLWNPNLSYSDVVEDFLKTAASIVKTSIPMGMHLRDDEQALFLLQQCGHNHEEALRRLKMSITPSAETAMSPWSDEECRNFESGVRTYGKNFHLIQQNKVRTRSVGELVQFYYLWKKSERHDLFANKTRLEKKKYTLHPGLTDFMDRFLEDQEGRDRSSSPNVQCGPNEKKYNIMDVSSQKAASQDL